MSAPGLLACDSPQTRAGVELVVLAAASLGEVFPAMATAFEQRNPELTVLLNFAGSQTLGTQLREGFVADVIALAHPELMDDLVRDQLVDSPQVFATNRLVWIVHRSSPTPPALSRRIVLAAPEVPAGRYAREALDRLQLLPELLSRVVSEELNVKGVLTKVQISGADAGIVYATDVRPETSPELAVIELPAEAQVLATYPMARVRTSPHPAEANQLLAFIRSGAGQAILRRAGFGLP